MKQWVNWVDRECLSNTGKVEKPAWLFGSFIWLTKKKMSVAQTTVYLKKQTKKSPSGLTWGHRDWTLLIGLLNDCTKNAFAHTHGPRYWHTGPRFGPVTGSPPAGTEAPWRWSNPPGSPAGTQKWASPPALSSSRSASDHAGIRGTPLGTAFYSHAPPGPTPLCSPYLGEQVITQWLMCDPYTASLTDVITCSF